MTQYRYDKESLGQHVNAPKPPTSEAPTPPGSPPSGPQPAPYAPPNPPNGGKMTTTSSPRRGGWFWKVVATILAIAAIVYAILAIFVWQAWWKPNDRPTPSEDILRALQFEVPTQKCEPDSNGLVSFRVEGLMPGRKWSNSIALPMDGVNAEAALAQMMDTVCHDPSFGATVAAGLAHATDGQMALVNYYEWLKPFRFEEVDEIAKDYMPAFKNGAFRDDLSVDETLDAIQKNKDWQEVAALINTALANLNNMGIQSPQSVWNAHQVGRSDVGLPEVALNDSQENLPALVLGLTKKGEECPIFQIAFNVGDKRPEGVNICKEAEKVVPVQHRLVPPVPTPQGPPPVAPPPSGPPPVGPPPVNPPGPNCTTHPVPECFPIPPETKTNVSAPLPQAPPAAEGRPPATPRVPEAPSNGEQIGSSNNEDRHSVGGVSPVEDQQQPVHDAAPDINMGAQPEPEAQAPDEAPITNVDPDA
jgi:hypothetical protein